MVFLLFELKTTLSDHEFYDYYKLFEKLIATLSCQSPKSDYACTFKILYKNKKYAPRKDERFTNRKANVYFRRNKDRVPCAKFGFRKRSENLLESEFNRSYTNLMSNMKKFGCD